MGTLTRFAMIFALLLAGALGGCADFTAGPAPLDRTVDPQLTLGHARAGHVYCARGWLGIFSTGMTTLADKLDKDVGVSAVSVADMEYTRLEEWLIAQHKKGTMDEPLVLLGHSYGADDMIRVAEGLKPQGMSVDLLVLVDPVTPPAVPTNVKRVFCVYKSHPMTDWYPAWRGVAARVEDPKVTPIENIDLRTANVGFDTSEVGHANVEKFEGVHNMAIEEIKKVCPPRTVWARSHPEPIISGRAGARANGGLGEPVSRGEPVAAKSPLVTR